ncbi:DUF6799 domain-containing protein [Adhaeribacter soli]|uniref:DUF6799 domain-containing protein n=1 Tax=Adhaeribacter soli TaxID=2607655 RepID=A0A5N1IJ09_9BACT|nr:DUF6799 domain-containing protein [Adhaeribacter soli]KAA9325398.1 hypothetical protein F0P94_17580 [Adhaeribacter soli]
MQTAFKLFLCWALALFVFQASAQATMPRKGAPKHAMRDGAAKKFGKMVEIRKGKESPLTRTYTAENGTKVMTNGTVVFPDGRKEKLAEGYAINKQGNKVILEDDMIAPKEIREQKQRVTGDSERTITVTEKTRVIINDSTGRKAVRDTIRTTETK